MLSEVQYAFVEEIYIEMYDKMLVYANCTLRDIYLSEEAAQETFRIACGKINDFYSSANPRGWLINTLKNVIRNIERNRQTLSKYFYMSLDIDAIRTESFDELSLESLYGNIADSDDFMLMKYIAVDKSTMLDAAAKFGISLEVCKKRVQRAKKNLRTKIEGDNG